MTDELLALNFKNPEEAHRFKDILRCAVSFHQHAEKIREAQDKKAASLPKTDKHPDLYSITIGAKLQRFHDYLGAIMETEDEYTILEEVNEYFFNLFHEFICDDDEES